MRCWLLPLLLACSASTAATALATSFIAEAVAAARTASSISAAAASDIGAAVDTEEAKEGQEPKPTVFGDVTLRVPLAEVLAERANVREAAKLAVRTESSANVLGDTEVPNVWLLEDAMETSLMRVRFQVEFASTKHRQSFIRLFVEDGAQQIATGVCAAIKKEAGGVCGLPDLDSLTSGLTLDSGIPLAKAAALETEQLVVRGGTPRTELGRDFSISATTHIDEHAAAQLPGKKTISGNVTFIVNGAHDFARNEHAQEGLAVAIARTAEVSRDQIATIVAELSENRIRVDFWVPSPSIEVRRAFISKIFWSRSLMANINKAVPAPWKGQCVLVSRGATSKWWKP